MDENGRTGLKIASRLGYAARGVVYLLVGGLAVLVALGQGGRTTDTKGALRTLLDTPWGDALLGVIAVGLLGYAVWRFVQAVWDVDRNGTDAKGLAVRAGLLVSSVTHVGLAVFAIGLIRGGGGGGGGGKAQWTAWLMRQPWGQWLVALVGLVVIGVGIAQAAKAHKEKYKRYLRIDYDVMRWAEPVCKFGLYARGVVFVIIGGFFLVAAWQADPSEAGGLAQAMAFLRGQAYGRILFGIVALGLFAFGVYSLIQAKYRRIRLPE
ncbi:MAG: DUF1206 domain-containing protein [Desulfocurvibacter africanus]